MLTDLTSHWDTCVKTSWTEKIASIFFFNDTATTEIYTLSLHDALPISLVMMTPSGRMMNPEPSPRIGCGCGIWNGRPRKNGANGLLGPKGLVSLGLSLSSPG